MRNAAPCLLLLALSAPAIGQIDSGLQRCSAIADPTSRLACYDSLAAARAPVVARAGAPPLQQASRPATNFGLPSAMRSDEAQSVQSSVGSKFSGWNPDQWVRLDDGQVWQVIDGTSVALPEGARQVVVRRGALGSFYLDIEGLKTSPRVRRLE